MRARRRAGEWYSLTRVSHPPNRLHALREDSCRHYNLFEWTYRYAHLDEAAMLVNTADEDGVRVESSVSCGDERRQVAPSGPMLHGSCGAICDSVCSAANSQMHCADVYNTISSKLACSSRPRYSCIPQHHPEVRKSLNSHQRYISSSERVVPLFVDERSLERGAGPKSLQPCSQRVYLRRLEPLVGAGGRRCPRIADRASATREARTPPLDLTTAARNVANAFDGAC